MVLIKIAWDNLPEKYERTYPNIEFFRKAIQMQAGFFYEVILPDGTIKEESESISFEKMDEIRFKEVYEGVVDVILKYILVGTQFDEINEEVENKMKKIAIEVASSF
jgi:hypothetical protein